LQRSLFIKETKRVNILNLVKKIIVLLFLFPLFLSGCENAPKFNTLEDILEAGEITVITRNNAHCYYFYRDQDMGFEYDLAKAFADYLGVKLKIKIAEHWDGMIPDIINGKGDFIAASMTITPKRQNQVAFSDGYMAIQQHIIAHRNNLKIKNAEDLDGKTVNIRKGTSYQERLEELKEEGIDIIIKLHEDIATEELIRLVADEDIEVTIADSNIALLNRRYYPKAISAGPISEKEYLGWAVNPKAKKILKRINSFFKEIHINGKYAEIYNKYYANVDIFDYVDLRAFHKRIKTRLPRYKPLIKEAAYRYDFDWRLIAAQVYQESHFNPRAKSHAGAYGLMQLTFSTAKSLGVKNIFNPLQNINGGVKHLRNLYNHFNKTVGSDSLFIALAAYNVGQGHIFDARNLAKTMNLNPNKWSSLEQTLPLLRYRKYYKNATYGYCRGREPIKYIKQIMIYYDILKRQGIEYKTDVVS